MYSQFNTPQNAPYIETYLAINAKSVKYASNANKKFQGSVDITLIFRQDSIVKDYKKYTLLSPEVEDSNAIKFIFLDQQRFSLPNGKYSFDILFSDHNNPKSKFESTEEISIDFKENNLSISNIEMLESFKKIDNINKFSKSGYELIPYVSDFYPESNSKIKFYSEIYNSDKKFGTNQPYITSFYIENYETGKKLFDYVRMKKTIAAPVNVVLSEFDISQLASGNYNLVIEVIDPSNSVISNRKIFFYRSNPSVKTSMQDLATINISGTFADRITSVDSLNLYIRSTRPISNPNETSFIDNQLKTADLHLLQQYFYHFWEVRSDNPEQKWIAYKIEVNKVNASFSTRIRRGFDTDRGRIYLQYGPPNSITESKNEPSSYPYEIWHYYKLKNQSNRKFVFYNPDLVSNDFPLLHSDAFGEMNDPNWQNRLKIRNLNSTQDGNSINNDRTWGDKSKQNFETPY